MTKLSNDLLDQLSKNLDEQNKLLTMLLDKLNEDVESIYTEPLNRPANLKELGIAFQMLLHMEEDSLADTVSSFIKACKDDPLSAVSNPQYPMVVADFSQNIESNIILVPSGKHRLPESFIEHDRFFIGLSEDPKVFPILVSLSPNVSFLQNGVF